MPIFVIERDFPGAQLLSAADLRGIAAKACDALREMGSKVQWIQSFVTDERIYCLYVAADAQQVREHAKRAGLPASRVSEARSVIGPVGAE